MKCPYCQTELAGVTGGELPSYPNSTPVVCMSCANLLWGMCDEDGKIAVGKLDYDWLHSDVFLTQLERIRECQEKQHHKNGHWG